MKWNYHKIPQLNFNKNSYYLTSQTNLGEIQPFVKVHLHKRKREDTYDQYLLYFAIVDFL